MQQRFVSTTARNIRRAFGSPSFSTYTNFAGNQPKKCTLVAGTHAGPDLTRSAVECVKATGAPIIFEPIENFDFSKESCKEQLLKNKYILAGNLAAPGSKYIENVEAFHALDLQMNMIHVANFPNVKTRQSNIDMIIIRENLEGEYSGIEHEVYPGVFESLKVVTREKASRVADFAFQHAMLTGRKKVTCVHKANIMKLVDGLFLECAREAAKNYPSVEFEEMIVDNTCMQLAKNPQQFDVMLMPNLYGSIVGATGAGLVGGAGVVASTSFGPNYVMFEPGTRKSGKDLTATNCANPTCLILAATNLLMNCGYSRFADLLKDSVTNVYREGKYLTPDVGGNTNCTDFTKRVVDEIKFLDSEYLKK